MKCLYAVTFICEDTDHSLISKFVCAVCSTRSLAIQYVRRQGVCIDYKVPQSGTVRLPAYYKEGRFYSYLINKVLFYEKEKN